MLSKKKFTNQLGFYSTFEEQLSHTHPLYILANKINWGVFEDAFAKLYSEEGRPAKPIRLMVSLLLLKHIRKFLFWKHKILQGFEYKFQFSCRFISPFLSSNASQLCITCLFKGRLRYTFILARPARRGLRKPPYARLFIFENFVTSVKGF